jgi:uncharacterized membrane protein
MGGSGSDRSGVTHATGDAGDRNQAPRWDAPAIGDMLESSWRFAANRVLRRARITMTYLIAGLVLFLGMHSIAIFASDWRDSMVARMGEYPWKGVYSLLSIAGFVLLIWGYGMARQDPIVLYTPPTWCRYVAAVLMLPAFPLLLAAYLPGRIKTVAKHPMLNAVKFWSLAHLFANGMLADVLLFGGFLLWAGLDRLSFRWRPARVIRTAPPRPYNDLIAVVAGLALYVLFTFYLHVRWIGVAPLP